MRIVFVLFALLVMSGASAQTREEQDKLLSEYLPYAGEPVDRFQFWQLIRYELVGEYKVIVWPRLNEAYLLTVREPCLDLQWARALGFTSTLHTVNQHFDYLLVGDNKCRIKEIRPIDYKKYRADLEAAKDVQEDLMG